MVSDGHFPDSNMHLYLLLFIIINYLFIYLLCVKFIFEPALLASFSRAPFLAADILLD